MQRQLELDGLGRNQNLFRRSIECSVRQHACYRIYIQRALLSLLSIPFQNNSKKHSESSPQYSQVAIRYSLQLRSSLKFNIVVASSPSSSGVLFQQFHNIVPVSFSILFTFRKFNHSFSLAQLCKAVQARLSLEWRNSVTSC